MIGTDPAFLAPGNAGLRLSDGERRDAVAALERAHAEGRITSEELTDRTGQVRLARTRGDLVPVFADLPETEPSAAAPGPAAPARMPAVGVMLIALSPFVALVLFFGTGVYGGWDYAWLWFLLVPVTAIIVNGLRGRLGR